MQEAVDFTNDVNSAIVIEKGFNEKGVNSSADNEGGHSMAAKTRKEQKEQRRQEIIQAALEVFVSKGFAATKVTDIAKQANMSTGLMFHYFESKEHLYEELVRLGVEATRQPGSQACEHAIDYLNGFTTLLFAYMRRQPVRAKYFVLLADAARSEATPASVREMAMQAYSVEEFAAVMEWGQKEGTIRAGEPIVLANGFWSSIQGIAQQYAANREIDLPEPDWIIDMVRKH